MRPAGGFVTRAGPFARSSVSPAESSRHGLVRKLTTAAILAALYVAAGKFGLLLGIVNPSATAVWAPTGIALAALLILGPRAWPGIFVGAFITNATTAGTLATSLGIAIGNTLEGLVGATLVRRFANGRHAFDRPPDTFKFAALAGMLATVVSATIGVTTLSLGGFAPWSAFGPIWLTWWLGDMGGALVVAPLLVLWSNDPRPRWTRAQTIEAVALLVALGALGYLIFGTFGTFGSARPFGQNLMFLCMPLLAWSALRFDPRITAAACFEISAVAVWCTLTASTSMGRESVNESLLLLQLFVAVAGVTTLSLAAVVSERRRIDAAVRATTDELHEAMTELEAFSHSITHDLRTPVGAVILCSDVLAQDYEGQLGEAGARMVKRIRGSAGSAAHLLEQLTQYAWVGRESGEHLEVDMTALAREVQAELVVGGADVSDVEFQIQPLPAGRGNPDVLRCVFRNLMSNAVKYTRGRKPRTIRVSGTAGPQENTYTVSDNGIGFDQAMADRLFEPYERLSEEPGFEGSGLGLAIVARIIRRQHGRVWARSSGSDGAQFSFSLPTQRTES